jgi:hypothetical protein
MNKVFVITFLILISGKLCAQIITDRPDQTESSSTVPLGALQLESGILISYEEVNKSTLRQILLPTTLFRYGITKGFELRILSQIETIKFNKESVQGISDLEIGTKIQIWKKEDRNTEIAFLTHLLVPTGTIELTGDQFGTINKISISHGVNERFGIGYNIGYNYFGVGSGDLTYSLAFGIGVNEKVGVYVEPFGEVANLREFISNADAGFTYLVNEDLQMDFSFGTGLNNNMNYASIGISWLIDRE